jgi:hypothetical protein
MHSSTGIITLPSRASTAISHMHIRISGGRNGNKVKEARRKEQERVKSIRALQLV